MTKPLLQRPSQPQIKYLRDLLQQANRNHSTEIGEGDCPVPDAVKAARKIIKAWEDTARRGFYAKQERRRKVLRYALADAQRAMLFSSPADALKAVDAFAAKKF